MRRDVVAGRKSVLAVAVGRQRRPVVLRTGRRTGRVVIVVHVVAVVIIGAAAAHRWREGATAVLLIVQCMVAVVGAFVVRLRNVQVQRMGHGAGGWRGAASG